MMRVSELRLYSSDPTASQVFLGQQMAAVGSAADTDFAEVRFVAMPNAWTPSSDELDAFWKFSVFADDIVKLQSALVASGHTVSDPVQFGDIGYLCHLQEPGGNAVELLQRTFKANPPPTPPSPDTLGLVTLRVSDLEASLAFYQQGLGMRLLSTMAVDDGRPDPFDLYFFGWGNEPAPDPEVSSVANREWTYQRRSTLIELQHYRTSPGDLTNGAESGSRLHSVGLAADDLASLEHDLADVGALVTPDGASLTFASPDGHRFVAAVH